jgi:hypothetical protein
MIPHLRGKQAVYIRTFDLFVKKNLDGAAVQTLVKVLGSRDRRRR